MGAGCSSPLRRISGKRAKQTRRDSNATFEANSDENDKNLDQQSACRQQPTSSSLTQQQQQHKLVLENENTIQSEINEDHPSTASYYTDVKNIIEENKVSEHSTGLELKSSSGNATLNNDPNNRSLGGGSAASRFMGLNGTYVPHDRHLLVSPALSPAPSTCYSPSPANSVAGSATIIDLNDLNEAFRTLTFGMPDQINTHPQRIRHPNYERQQSSSELQNYYTQHLVQNQADLTKCISVVFITADTFQPPNTTNNSISSGQDDNVLNSSTTNVLANLIESNLQSFCDEHLFYLRFLNLSHAHLSEHFHISNLLDASMKVLEQEYQENSQRFIIIALSNYITNYNISSGETNLNTDTNQQNYLEKRQLPTKIEAQTFNKLQEVISKEPGSDQTASGLLKRWYNQVGNTYYLNPIYLVNPEILSEAKGERQVALQNWLVESSNLIKTISQILETNQDLASEIKLKTLFSSYIDYIINEPALHKRTLLIRNYSQSMNNTTMSNQQQSQQSVQGQIKDTNLNEIARLLADPSKLTLKRPIQDEDLNKIINNWIMENFNKFFENIVENQLLSGKHVPPFMERNLFIELTRQRHYLEHYLDNVTENFQTKCQSFYDSQILPILNDVINGTSNQVTCPNLEPELEDRKHPASGIQQTVSANHLVFISGPKGCGKSSLFAQIVKLAAQDFFNKCQIIYRFCGMTLDSMKPNRLLRSICEQFCQTQGENITAASYIYSARREIMNSLNKIIQQQTSLVFLDGLDTFNNAIGSDLDWLCEIEANPRVKFFITLETDSDLYKKTLGSYTDASYISLDNPSLTEWAQMLTSTARSRRFNSATNLYDEIKNLDIKAESKETKLTYKDFSDVIHMCRIRKLNNESIYPELTVRMMQNNPIQSLKNVQQVALSHLNYLLAPRQLCALFIILNSSRNGLNESDILSIMTMISSKLGITETKFSQTLFNYMKIQLQPWLIYIICDNTVKVMIQHDFISKAISYYITNLFPNMVTEIRGILLEYFKLSYKSKLALRVNVKKGDERSNSDHKDFLNSSESQWLATQSSETVHLLILTNPAKAKDLMLNKLQFFLQFIYGTMPEEYIEDYEELKNILRKKSSTSLEELRILVNSIKQSIYPLRYDGSQIYSQVYCRAHDTLKSKGSHNQKLGDILAIASAPPTRNLLPLSEASINSFIRARIGHNYPPSTGSLNPTSSSGNQKLTNQSSSQIQARQKIYTIKDNHRHVIVIYPEKGSLSVWDIFEEKAVRTINNLDQPRDLRMIDQKRAVILCNRELRVYDLNSGTLLNKLKGVMNQKMPFFEVFGENYVVALARNRMYVNMLNLNTGELETTFKVGEDRFLNSLLVSANGGICVCGDETQKPFPLLVWNLNERRLMYDLRLDRHEFLTRMSAISDDGHFVVSVCRQLGDSEHPHQHVGSNSSNVAYAYRTSPNFIVIYDLNSGTLFKKWKPGLDSCAVAISLTSNRSGKVVNAIVNNTILVWDLATGSKRHTLFGHSSPVDVIRVQNNRLFSMDSTCRDQSLRIWDLDEGYCLSVFSPDAPINCCQISIRGDALVCGFAAETRLSTLAVCKNETVNDIIRRNKRRKSSKTIYIFDEQQNRKSSS